MDDFLPVQETDPNLFDFMFYTSRTGTYFWSTWQESHVGKEKNRYFFLPCPVELTQNSNFVAYNLMSTKINMADAQQHEII